MAQSQRFAGQLRQALGDVQVTISPLITPVLLTPEMPEGRFDAVIFTSETAVSACRTSVGGGHGLPMRAYCVGDRTAAAAGALGFDARSAGRDAAALIALIRAQPPAGRLLHLHGQQTRGSVADTLTAAGIATSGVVVYRQDAQPLSAQARALLQGAGAVFVPLFSPRSAALFRAELQALPRLAPLSLFSLSSAVDAELGENPPAARFVASDPDADALISLILQRYAAERAP